MASLLEFRNVTSASPDVEKLADFTFSLSGGENAVFFGIEGSGCKSIAQLVFGLAGGHAGDILYKGRSILDLDYLGRLTYKSEIGYLHGDFGLQSNLSVEQNISLRLEYYSHLSSDEIRDTASRIMKELHIDERRDARPVELTQSEILRAAYARAVVRDPDLLIIEHAFVGLSPLNIASFMNVLIKRISNPGKSILFVTYEPEKFVDFSDAFYMLYRGGIVFHGTRREFLDSDNPYLLQYRNISIEGPMKL